MQSPQTELCEVCLKTPENNNRIMMKCTHAFCKYCLKEYVRVLKLYRQITPEKLQCIHEGCSQQIDDGILMAIFPGEEGFLLKTIRKCYRQSKNPSAVVFCCTGLVSSERKQLISKDMRASRQQHTKLINNLARDIKGGKTAVEGVKSCNNIHVYNRAIGKDKFLQCYQCGCSFCLMCFDIMHEGLCSIVETNPMLQLKKSIKGDNFQEFINANQMRRCLNPKCGLPIAKEQGCYWVKCRCTWQMCYPCGKLWGSCEHFSKYPYQKFTPPAQWLVKALNLY